jgi:integrase/recombinase XerD
MWFTRSQNKIGRERSCFDVCDFTITHYSTGVAIMATLREKMKQEMTLRGLSNGTQKQYLRAVIKLHNHYNRSPAKLSEAQIKSFLLSVISQPCSASAYNIMIHGLKFFYEVVLNRKMVAIHLPRKKEPQKLPDILSQSEIERIIKCTDNLKHRTILILIYGAGLRAKELASLRVTDIDSDRCVIHIRQGKGNKDRYVILSPFMLASLRTYWKKCRRQKPSNIQESDFLFLGHCGKALSPGSIGKIYKRSKHKACIKKQGGVHALRHAFATHALESGADLYVIKQMLGHASVLSTIRYLRMTEKTRQMVQSPVEQLKL